MIAPASTDQAISAISARILSEPLQPLRLYERAAHPASGALVLFCGVVRDKNHGRSVDHLEYEAYVELAEKMMEQILRQAAERWQLNAALAEHRTGRLEIGEVAVVVVTSCGHREECYQANRYIIDTLKSEVPIWKKEVFLDGSQAWGNHCHC